MRKIASSLCSAFRSLVIIILSARIIRDSDLIENAFDGTDSYTTRPVRRVNKGRDLEL